ncbi:probable myosin-binding protein 4 isoform X2 [Triticum aestivum]|uniref:probable myosin-binding protein 4 isoform X2 n=1 Tax=Triticum aestivum TaxID=4565 RepID=UPI001D00B852|nr:probable myosin-binding protein 4 isoform X2 [Triticum aestivum]
MAAKARARPRDSWRRFWLVLGHALSECFLIVMLLVVAVVSYTATRFARICRIRSPCMLCSRLDKVLHGKAWFSEELICAAHRVEIARLSYCQIHSKLAHSDDLCGKCLLSCSGPVGKPGNPTNMSIKEKAGHTHRCSCCSEPFTKRDNAHKLFEEVNGRSQNDGMSKVKERSMATASVGHSSDEDFDQLPHGGYRKLNACHDSQSEIHVSDDDVGGYAKPYEAKRRTRDLDEHSKAVPQQIRQELPKEKTFLVGVEEVGDLEGVSRSPDQEAAEAFAASASNEARSTTNHYINRNSSMKNAPGGRGNLRSPRWSEVISAKETNSTTHEEVKTFMSQLSSARGLDGPWSEVAASPRISIQIDEYSQSDAIDGRQFLDLEPSDVPTEAEGEISPESLKKQCELNKKKLSILYKELEAERSASSVAASEAMAMINRLQVEKAAMHMEALQYLRMMEEQADHDQEEIGKLNDLLTEREKEMLDLEAELESYESKFRIEPFDLGNFDAVDGDMALSVLDSSDFVRNTIFGFEDEKAKILESLSRLEETLGVPYTNRFDLGGASDILQSGSLRDHPSDGPGQDLENSELECQSSLLPQEHMNDESHLKDDSMRDHPSDGPGQHVENSELECRSSLLPQEDLNDESLRDQPSDGPGQYVQNPELECRSSLLPQEDLKDESVSLQRNDENQSVENQKYVGSCSRSDDDKISSVESIKQEISLLNSRLMALEADQKFLKQILSSLKCSSDGEQYVQEITSHLRELRRIVTKQRDRTAL